MSGDYSRDTFDPQRDFSAVLMQQGRVQLDADWNEWVAIVERRIRAGTLDTIGPAVVARTTPDAFRIQVAGGELRIGPGRIYVDGILAENHGADPVVFDPRLEELAGTTAASYAAQPAYPNPPALPQSGGPYVVYLDVWQREVTAAERPELVEPAIGVDTTTRLQTVSQVKVLDGGAGVTCETDLNDIPAWTASHPPAAARLTVTTRDIGEPGPCEVPPAPGFRGTENQLYRVEIHDDGRAGEPVTFKWSRDNGSVVSRVTHINTARDQLVVESLGRDEVLGFRDGDWIEVTDDWRELHNRPGQLRRIRPAAGIDQVTRTLILDRPLDAGWFPTDAQQRTTPARNTRVRRWDQRGVVLDGDGERYVDLDDPASTGAIPVPASGMVHLEDGIVVALRVDASVAAGGFRSGDYWMFAARAGDGRVDELADAPPAGIHHHYAKLAIVDFPDDDGRRDCRTQQPTSAGCCLRVAVGDDVQQAVNRVIRAGGGCLCLAAGVHEVSGPLLIERASGLSLHGEGPATVLRLLGVDENGLGGIVMSRSREVTFEALAIVGVDVPAAIWALSVLPGVRNANQSLVLRDLAIVNATAAPEGATRTAVRLGRIDDVRIESCRLVGDDALTALFSDRLPTPYAITPGSGPEYGRGVRRLRMSACGLRFGSTGVRALACDGWQVEGCDMRPLDAALWADLQQLARREQVGAAWVGELSQRILDCLSAPPQIDRGTAVSAFLWRDCTLRQCDLAAARGLDVWWWFRGSAQDNTISAGQDAIHVTWLHAGRVGGNRLLCPDGRALVAPGSFRAIVERNQIRAHTGIAHATWEEELARLLEYVPRVAAAYGAVGEDPAGGSSDAAIAESYAFWMLLRESIALMRLDDLVAAALEVIAPDPAQRDQACYLLSVYLLMQLKGHEGPVPWPLPHLALTISDNDVQAGVACLVLDRLLPLGGLRVSGNRMHAATGQALRIEAIPVVANADLTFLLWRFGVDYSVNRLLPMWKESAAGDPAKEAWIPFADRLGATLLAALAASEAICDADHRIEANQMLSAATAIHCNLGNLTIRANRITLRQQQVSIVDGGLIVGTMMGNGATSALAHAMRDGEPRALRRRLAELAGDVEGSAAATRREGTADVFRAIAGGARHPDLRSAAERVVTGLASADSAERFGVLDAFAEVAIPFWNSFGIVAASPGCRIEDNDVTMPPDIDVETWSRGGILVATDPGEGIDSSVLALVLGLVNQGDELSAVGLLETRVSGNRIAGGFGHGIHVFAPIVFGENVIGLADLRIVSNEIRGMGGAGIRVEAETQAIGADLSDNRILDCSSRVELASLTNGKGGIHVANAALCRIRGNQVARCARGEKAQGAFAVDIEGCYGLAVEGNELLYSGGGSAAFEAGGVRLGDVYGQVTVRDNRFVRPQGVGLLWNNSSDEDGALALPPDLLLGAALYLKWGWVGSDIGQSEIAQDARRARATVSGNQWTLGQDLDVPAFSLLRIGDLVFSSNSGTSSAPATGIGKISSVRRCVMSQNQFTCPAAETVALCDIGTGVVSGNVTTSEIGLYFSPDVDAGLNVPPVARY
jgi:hypothetical protein